MLVAIAGLAHHEMWRDELQIWMLVRDSDSLINLFHHLRYETGHPFLWYLLLYPFSRLTRSPLMLQGVHLAIAATSVYLVARYAPFNRLQKTLFAFSYFALFEYCQISRNYGLGMMLLFLVCVLFPQRRTYPVVIACLLFLAANSNFYAMVCAAAIGVMVIAEEIWQRKSEKRWLIQPSKLILSLGIWAVGIGLYALQLIPMPDAGIDPSTVTTEFKWSHLASTLAMIWKSYAPFPWFSLNFWNTNLVSEGDAALFSLILLLGAIALFWRKPLILLLYTTGTFSILILAYLKHGGGIRHWGYLFVLLLICLWLEPEYPSVAFPHLRSPLQRLQRFLVQWKSTIFTGILTVQVMAGLFAYSMDWVHPFSQAKATATYLQTNNSSEIALAGDRDWAALSVSGYLDRPLYYPASDRTGTFVIWNNQRTNASTTDKATTNKALIRIDQHFQSKNNGILVLNYPLTDIDTQKMSVTPTRLNQFTGAIVNDENFYLYQLQN